MHLLSERPNKVLLLWCRNTASPWHHCFSTTVVTETMPSCFAWTFGQYYANISTSWRKHVGHVWMSRFRGAWQSLNFDREYLFGFETLVFATSGILSMHNQLVIIQRERKTWNCIIWPLEKASALSRCVVEKFHRRHCQPSGSVEINNPALK